MDDLFLLLFLVSFACLIVGLVKPTIFSRFIKGEITRKKIGLIFGIATLAFFVMFGMTTDTNKQTQPNTSKKVAEQKTEPKQLSPEEQAKKAEAEAVAKKIADEEKAKTYSTITLTDVTVSNDHVTISGTTDLPDGAKLATSFDVWGRSATASWIGSEGEAQVSKGSFTSTLVISQRDEFAKGPYEISILFTPIGGVEQITNLVGKNGENLTGNLVKQTYGFKTMELLVKKDLIISVSPVKYNFVFQLPSQYSQGTAESSLAEFASSWKKQDWEGMTIWVAKDWVSRQNNSATLLSNMLNFKYLEGFKITNVDKRSDVLTTITFEAQYRLWASDSTNIKNVQISADIRKEDDNGFPDSNGAWGVYPLYSEKDIE